MTKLRADKGTVAVQDEHPDNGEPSLLTNYRPLEDRVIVRQEKADARTPGGILLPETTQSKPMRGLVVAVGPGRVTDGGTLVPMLVRVGDRVIFARFSGTAYDEGLAVGDKDLVIMRQSDILAVKDK